MLGDQYASDVDKGLNPKMIGIATLKLKSAKKSGLIQLVNPQLLDQQPGADSVVHQVLDQILKEGSVLSQKNMSKLTIDNGPT